MLKKSKEIIFLFQKDITLQFLFWVREMTDLKYLQQMTGNDSSAMREFIDLYLNQLNDMQADVAYLMECRNWYELSRLADKIKSSALIMGVDQIADEMKELEQLAIEGKNSEKYLDYVENLNTLIDLVRVELEPYLEDRQIDIIKE